MQPAAPARLRQRAGARVAPEDRDRVAAPRRRRRRCLPSGLSAIAREPMNGPGPSQRARGPAAAGGRRAIDQAAARSRQLRQRSRRSRRPRSVGDAAPARRTRPPAAPAPRAQPARRTPGSKDHARRGHSAGAYSGPRTRTRTEDRERALPLSRTRSRCGSRPGPPSARSRG